MSTEIARKLGEIFARCHNAGSVTEERIRAVEVELSVNLPSSYRSFLQQFGASWFHPPFEIAGIHPPLDPDQTPEWDSLVLANKQLRRAGVPEKLLYFSSDGCDVKLYLDTSVVSDGGECPVIALGPGFDHKKIAESFLSFVEVAAKRDPLDAFDDVLRSPRFSDRVGAHRRKN